MRYMRKRRSHQGKKAFGSQAFADDDPLSGVANLFDVGLVFIVGLIVTLFSAYHLQELFSQKGELTIVKKAADGQMEIIRKKGEKIDAVKVSRKKAKGKGTRLGVAYRLENGAMVYVPDESGALAPAP